MDETARSSLYDDPSQSSGFTATHPCCTDYEVATAYHIGHCKEITDSGLGLGSTDDSEDVHPVRPCKLIQIPQPPPLASKLKPLGPGVLQGGDGSTNTSLKTSSQVS